MAYFVNNKRSSYVGGLELISPELNKFWYNALLLSRSLELLISRKFQITYNITLNSKVIVLKNLTNLM